MSKHTHTHIRKDSTICRGAEWERGLVRGGAAAAMAVSQSVRGRSGRREWCSSPSVSKGLCTSGHYCSVVCVCGSLKHCHRDRGWPFHTPRPFCSTTMMGKLHPAMHSSRVRLLDLSVNPPVSEVKPHTHTYIKNNYTHNLMLITPTLDSSKRVEKS